MTVYVDTSAFLALLNADDEFHFKASSIWSDLLASNIRLVTNSFVLVETYALVQNRLGLDAVRTVAQDIIPLFEIHWIDNDLYQPAITACLSANRRYLSLVDCSSFITMLRSKITKVFTFDSHFAEQGFEVII
jgi:predicted nucleic acid-binding protein